MAMHKIFTINILINKSGAVCPHEQERLIVYFQNEMIKRDFAWWCWNICFCDSMEKNIS